MVHAVSAPACADRAVQADIAAWQTDRLRHKRGPVSCTVLQAQQVVPGCTQTMRVHNDSPVPSRLPTHNKDMSLLNLHTMQHKCELHPMPPCSIGVPQSQAFPTPFSSISSRLSTSSMNPPPPHPLARPCASHRHNIYQRHSTPGPLHLIVKSATQQQSSMQGHATRICSEGHMLRSEVKSRRPQLAYLRMPGGMSPWNRVVTCRERQEA